MVSEPLASVIIITRNRPQMLRDCMEHLMQQDCGPFETIVVDSSSSEDSQVILDSFPSVRRLRIPNGKNNMPQARNKGIQHARGEIVAFIDDDSMVRPGWLWHLLVAYTTPDVGGVGGRVVDQYEEHRFDQEGTQVGTFKPGGWIVSGFSLNPGGIIEVDHVRGCNMSFRKSVLQEIGGVDLHYTGWNTLEDTDTCMQVKKRGYRMLFQPHAVVDHLSVRWQEHQRARPGPWIMFHGHKNYSYFFFKNFGLTGTTLRHVFGSIMWLRLRTFFREPSIADGFDIFNCAIAHVVGMIIALLGRRPRSPMR